MDTIAARLMARSRLTDEGCLEWTGARSGGYGRMVVEGVGYYTHRLAWVEVNGPIPPGVVVCHRCDNPSCLYVPHLFLGTQADNLRDMVSKGRWKNGYEYCKRGHAMTGDNVAPNGKDRTCRACRRMSSGRRCRTCGEIGGPGPTSSWSGCPTCGFCL